MGKYSTDVKRIALEKIFQPGACLTDISDEMQIPRITLYVWMRSAQNGTMRKRNRRTNMTIVEKQALVIEARKLRDEELGLWLREKGLHESSIDAWEREINSVLSMHDQSASSRSDECPFVSLMLMIVYSVKTSFFVSFSQFHLLLIRR